MKFALVNGDKTEPQPKLRGVCTSCQSEMISKCGNIKVWHWSHKSKAPCDPWWENETEWHRAWKNRFPKDWQEIIHITSDTGEKHIADVKTDNGLVIEFQRSAILPEEIKSREAFYKNMVWVIDGTRLKRDYPKFLKGVNTLKHSGKIGFYLSSFPEECFPERWLTSKVPVYFDFQGINPTDQPDWTKANLWCIFPGRLEGYVVIAAFSYKEFIEFSSTTPHLLFFREILSSISQNIQSQNKLIAAAQARNPYLNSTFRPRSRKFRL